MSKMDAARANWRADLCEYHAAVLSEAGATVQAAEEQARADFHRTYASLMVELADAKASGDPAVLSQAKNKLSAFRKANKGDGIPSPAPLSDFIEPTNEELMIGA
jgi:hypothetical protein